MDDAHTDACDADSPEEIQGEKGEEEVDYSRGDGMEFCQVSWTDVEEEGAEEDVECMSDRTVGVGENVEGEEEADEEDDGDGHRWVQEST